MDSEFIGVTVASMDVFTRLTAVNSESMSRTMLNGPQYFQTKELTPY